METNNHSYDLQPDQTEKFKHASAIATNSMKILTEKKYCLKIFWASVIVVVFLCSCAFPVFCHCDESNSHCIVLNISFFLLAAITIIGCFNAIANIVTEEAKTKQAIVNTLINIYKEAQMNILAAEKKGMEQVESHEPKEDETKEIRNKIKEVLIKQLCECKTSSDIITEYVNTYSKVWGK